MDGIQVLGASKDEARTLPDDVGTTNTSPAKATSGGLYCSCARVGRERLIKKKKPMARPRFIVLFYAFGPHYSSTAFIHIVDDRAPTLPDHDGQSGRNRRTSS
jgi:hypothetical protein